MTKPTYEELDSIDMDAKAIANQNPIGTPFAWRKAYLAALAHAVLAKWGTPPAVAGDRTVSHKAQPTQPQTGAVPLSIAEEERMLAQWDYEMHGDRARYIEAAHGIGIKGGQHGTDTRSN